MEKVILAFVLGLLAVAQLSALKVDISYTEIDRALTLARSTESERARFHARYIRPVNTPFVDRAEVVSEFRRVVLLAEQQIASGDRSFAYSTTRAHQALEVYRRRVSVIAQVRFHPLNNYVSVPDVSMTLAGNESALVGVKRDGVYGFVANPGDFAPLIGAVIEASFRADSLGQAEREFVVSLDGKELGRFTFDFAAME